MVWTARRRPAADPASQPPAGTYGRAARRPDGTVEDDIVLVYSDETVDAHPDLPKTVPAGEAVHRRRHARRRRPLPRLRGQRPGRAARRRGRAAARGRPHAEPAAARHGARHRSASWRSSAPSPGWSCASACCRWIAWATPRARSPAAISRTASRRPTRAPRSAGSASRSTRCSTASSTRSPSGRRARSACGASWPTRRTSCARRWRRSAATPSCSASAPPRSRRTPRRPCAASRRRRSAWASSSRTCSCSPGSTRCRRPSARRSTSRALTADAVDDARATAPDRDIELERRREPRRSPASPTGCARCSRTCCATRSSTRRRGRRSRSASTHAGDRARLEVRDHGPGLPTDQPEHLFERFWRAEGGRERGRGGAGLGLAIVAAIVDAHGGEVSAGNAPDGGAMLRRDAARRGRRADAPRARSRPPRLTQSPLSLSRPLLRRGLPIAAGMKRRAHGHRRRIGRPACHAPARPSRHPRSTSSSRSTTRRRCSSTPSAACTGSSPPSCPSPGGSSSPTTRAPTTRRRSRARMARELPRRKRAAPRGEGPRPRAARRLVREPGAGRLLHGRRPLDGPARPAAARRPAAVGPLRPRHRHPPRARRTGGPRPQARAHLPRRTTRSSTRPCAPASAMRSAASRRCARACCAGSSTTCTTTAGSSTPSCSCSPSGAGCASTRSPSTGSTTPTRAWTSSGRRGTTCAASRASRRTARSRGSSLVGVLSTIAYALLFLLAARRARRRPAPTSRRSRSRRSATRRPTARYTFRVRGREGVAGHHLRGACVFVLTVGLTSGALAVLHGLDATPGRAVELGCSSPRASSRRSPATSRCGRGCSPGAITSSTRRRRSRRSSRSETTGGPASGGHYDLGFLRSVGPPFGTPHQLWLTKATSSTKVDDVDRAHPSPFSQRSGRGACRGRRIAQARRSPRAGGGQPRPGGSGGLGRRSPRRSA